MMAPVIHPFEALQELLDGRLEATQRETVETHLADCARCRRDLDLLRATRDGLKTAHCEVPALSNDLEFEARMRAALDQEDNAHISPAPSFRLLRRNALPLWVAAAAVVVAVFLRIRGLEAPVVAPPSSLVADAVSSFVAARDGTLVLDRTTDRSDELESYFARSAIGFPVRVLDLAMMGWRVNGGGVHRIGDHASALYVYRDGNHRLLVCQMFLGRIDELPAGGEHFSRGTIPFATYQSNRVTIVFWAEGNVLCALVSDLPRDAVVALATAKAMVAAS